MRKIRKGEAGWRLALVSVLAVAMTAAATPALAAGAPAPAWRAVRPPYPTARAAALTSISCSSSVACTTVGLRIGPGSIELPLAEAWDGHTWTARTLPAPTADDMQPLLVSVSCPSAGFCLAVGSYTDAQLEDATVVLAEEWLGGRWRLMSPIDPSAGGGGTAFSSVACTSSSSCVAVGNSYSSPLAERWNGSAWSLMSPAGPSVGALTLTGVTCPAATTCVASGFLVDGSARTPVAERWDGRRWTLASLPVPARAAGGVVEGIACAAATACLAVGGLITTGGGEPPLIAAWDGTGWHAETAPLPMGRTSGSLTAVSCTSPSSCVAVGYVSDAQGNAVPFAEQRGSGPWSPIALPRPPGSPSTFAAGVACPRSDWCYAVGGGYVGRRSVPLGDVWDGHAWSSDPPLPPAVPQPSLLTAVSCPSANACLAVGRADYQSIAERWDGGRWSLLRGPWSITPNGVSCLPDGGCLAVGSTSLGEPGAELWNGRRWSSLSVPDPQGAGGSLDAVSCMTPTSCLAVGDHGVNPPLAERWNGDRWIVDHPVAPPGATGSWLTGISCPTPSFCSAVGYYASPQYDFPVTMAEHWSSGTWTFDPTPTPPGASYYNEFTSVSCSAPDSCTAVGSTNGRVLVMRWNGRIWSLQHATAPAGSTLATLQGVVCTASATCTAVGWFSPASGGTLTLAEGWDGVTWRIQRTPNPAQSPVLNALACPTTASCVAVGAYDNVARQSSVPLVEMQS